MCCILNMHRTRTQCAKKQDLGFISTQIQKFIVFFFFLQIYRQLNEQQMSMNATYDTTPVCGNKTHLASCSVQEVLTSSAIRSQLPSPPCCISQECQDPCACRTLSCKSLHLFTMQAASQLLVTVDSLRALLCVP